MAFLVEWLVGLVLLVIGMLLRLLLLLRQIRLGMLLYRKLLRLRPMRLGNAPTEATVAEETVASESSRGLLLVLLKKGNAALGASVHAGE